MLHYNGASLYAFDIETSSLEPKPENHRLTAIIDEEECFQILDYRDTQAFLDTLPKKILIGHNIVGFDLQFFDVPDHVTVWDTMLMSKTLCRDRGFRHSLEACLERIGIVHTEKSLDAAAQEWDIHNLTIRQRSYIEQDVKYLFKLYYNLLELLQEFDLEGVCMKEHRVRKIANNIERNGLPLLHKEIAKKKREAEQAIPVLQYNINSYQQVSDVILGQGFSRNARLKKCKEVGINIKKHKTSGKLYISTDEASRHKCIMYGINASVAKTINEAKKAAAPLKHIAWMENAGDRLTSRYDNLGTATGRFAASGSAIQQMNRSLRTCFGHEDDSEYYVIKADWSQMELRLHAALNNDTDMIEVLQSNEDMHSLMACDAFGVRNPSKDERNLGKTANFTLLYMAGPNTLHKRLIMEGHYVDFNVAQRLYDAFHSRYPTIRERADEITAEANGLFPNPYECRIYGGLNRWIEWGRDSSGLWHFPLPMTMNTFIQGAGGAVLKDALLALPERMQKKVSAVVHDEIVLSFVTEDIVETYAEILKECMQEALTPALSPTGIDPAVDVTIGRTWGG